MKRDMDLVRKILFALEDKSRVIYAFGILKIDGHSDDAIEYHLSILSDSPYVALIHDSHGAPNYYRLTWEGHEFLESIRDNTRWNTVKEASQDAGGFVVKVAVETAIELVKEEVRRFIGLV